MTATISISEDLLIKAGNAAVDMGLSQDRFFEAAVEEFLYRHEQIQEPRPYSPEMQRFLDVRLEAMRKATEHDSW